MKRMMAFCMVCMLAALPLLAGEGEKSHAEMDKQMEEMHAAMMEAATPGEHHQHLASLAGDYTYEARAWMQPGAEPQEWSGERTGKMIMGGRYLEEHVDGTFMGMPFKGMGIYAYDNLAGEYVATWVDNMGTMVTQARGSCTANGWVFEGTHMVPGMGDNAFKEVIRKVDGDTFVFEWHEAMPGQDEMFKMMEITYTKKSS
jgi:hypothetical protein